MPHAHVYCIRPCQWCLVADNGSCYIDRTTVSCVAIFYVSVRYKFIVHAKAMLRSEIEEVHVGG